MSIEIKEDTLIPVLNKTQQSFHLQGRLQTADHSYFIPARIDEFTPAEVMMLFSDIQYINNLSSIFKTDLDIDLEYEEAVKNKLGGLKKDYIEEELTPEVIKDIIINPTTEKLNKIIAITSAVKIGVVKRTLTELMNDKNGEIAKNDISQRSIQVIDARYDEINKGVKKSEIKLVERQTEAKKKEVEKEAKKSTIKTKKEDK